jgi:hypothetical protein
MVFATQQLPNTRYITKRARMGAGGIRSQPAEGQPIVQQWHDEEKSYKQRRRSGNIVDPGRDWP